ncbi:pentatricopeptide repeat-containing protein At1g08070, chloroplastic-like [Phoenix dactylifera]|uniref:Pentatricopeptide repeat-containing protein At1g08070, chloroplastic-like n=1 Tax=Phoenix dactylifera TaxID=42345 RepID=A0A8B7BGL6_PHODC|nr:pentatricopeptide repeat-containing protein At1g08070, chloroplastic-like [Phoenix dactylifera]
MEQRLILLLQSPLHLSPLKQIHAVIVKSNPDLTPLFLGVLLNRSNMGYAQRAFDAIPQPDPGLSNSIIFSYSKLSMHKEVLKIFFSVHRKKTQILFHSIPSVLKSCAALAASNEGKQVHTYILIHGFSSSVFIQTSLIDFYSKNGDLNSARRVFNEIPVKDPVPINCLISGYSKSGNVLAARQLFDGMIQRTSSSWNSMITCYAHHGDFAEALRLFERMQTENARPNEITLVTVLSICAKLGDLKTGLKVKNLIENNDLRRNLIVQTAVLEMYVKCGAVDEARHEFDRMERRDVVGWSSMIAGYAQNGRPNEALELFERMKAENCKPNEVTLVSVLSACAQLGSVEVGERIGNYVERQGFALDVYAGSALVDMYSKCGNIKRARWIFNRMHQKDVVTWNSMIGGLAFNGFAKDAIELYQTMIGENLKPNDITFVALLTACTHAGLVDQGLMFFHGMKPNHNIVPKVEHCACIVDLLCRSGRLEDAYKFICEMEVEPNVIIWGTLLSACRAHSNVWLAELSVEKLLVLEPHNSANYVLLSNIYANAGRWEEARKVRDLMKNKNVQKLAAYSWIELEGMVHKFLVEDTTHPKSDEIYSIVDGLGLQLKWVGNASNFDLEIPDLS